MRRVILTAVLLAGLLWLPGMADVQPYDPPHVTDSYDIMFGSNMETCLGEPGFLVPINVSFSRPTERIQLIITYDPTVITPTLLAPNIFMQGFNYNISLPGRITLTMVTDLVPPPVVPPIYGDTTVAWISFRITTRDLGFNYPTTLSYYDDPTTPFNENYIVLNDNERIAPPNLTLHDGEILLIYPLYGDINLNTYPFEIADAVLFMNYLIGRATLNQCQLANADCNRDGVQASIADLVYMIRMINYDSMLIVNQPDMPEAVTVWRKPGIPPEMQLGSLAGTSYDIMINGDIALGGASFTIALDDSNSVPDAVVLDSAASYMQMYCSVIDNLLRVTMLNWDASNTSFKSGRLFSLRYSGVPPAAPFRIQGGDFSDNSGRVISTEYYLGGGEERGEEDTPQSELSLSGNPNPFKKMVTVAFDLPDGKRYQLAVFDILGRKVRTLIDGFGPAGANQVIWDGRDEIGAEVASGTYFVRLQGGNKIRTIKLFYLK